MADWDTAELAGQIKLNLREAFAEETARVVKLGGQKLKRIVDAYKDNAKNAEDLAKINRGIAATMRAAVLDAYQTNVLDRRSAPPYREDDPHRHSGALLAALQGDTIATGDAQGIVLGDPALLDRVAEHWARLNFGAEGGTGFSGVSFPPARVRVQFGKNQGFSLSFPGYQSPPFRVPEDPAFSGHFEKSGAFFLRYPKKVDHQGEPHNRRELPIATGKVAKGIGARHFMDAGLVAFAENFKSSYEAHFEDAARRAREQD